MAAEQASASGAGLRTRKDIVDIWTPVLVGKMTRQSNYSHLRVESFCRQGQVSKCPSGCGGLVLVVAISYRDTITVLVADINAEFISCHGVN